MHGKDQIDMRLLLRGDKAQWDAFVEQYAALIYSVICKIFLRYNKSIQDFDLQEVFQEVFVRLINDDHRLMKTYDPRKALLSTWLTIVTRSVAIDFLRRIPARHESLDDADIPDPNTRSESLPLTNIPHNLLSARQRLVLELLFEKGVDVSEAAIILGVDEQTIRSTKHKALEKLRKCLI